KRVVLLTETPELRARCRFEVDRRQVALIVVSALTDVRGRTGEPLPVVPLPFETGIDVVEARVLDVDIAVGVHAGISSDQSHVTQRSAVHRMALHSAEIADSKLDRGFGLRRRALVPEIDDAVIVQRAVD